MERNGLSADELKTFFLKDPVKVLNTTAAPENVNSFAENAGVLCIDIDGNDYHVWKAYEGAPDVVVIETAIDVYIPGPDWIPPYDPDSKKSRAGAGAQALKDLATQKCYRFHKKIGPNLFFVR